ncbi:MAG: secretin N-terminal domain-containing protein [Candidatus Babeliales bacterium]
MKKIVTLSLALALFTTLVLTESPELVNQQEDVPPVIINIPSESEVKDAPKDKTGIIVDTKKHKKKIRFELHEKPLIDLINELAAEKKVNILLPQGAFAIPATTKVTLSIQDAMHIDAAWRQLMSILDVAGYAVMYERTHDLYVIKKNDQNAITRSVMAIYIDRPIAELPVSDEIIRVVYYLQNLNTTTHKDDLVRIIKEMLSATADSRIDEKTNSLILTDKAVNIVNLLKIIKELDMGGIRDQIEVLPLYYASVQMVESIFQKLLDQKTLTESSYFSKNTKVIGLQRTNSLVIMGTARAIDAVRDFVIKYLDKPMDSGESILHVYELQYLQAEKFAPVLSNIISAGKGTDQSTGKTMGGPKQYFQDVIISYERIQDAEQLAIKPTASDASSSAQKTTVETKGVQLGGNRLIIAARKKDWIRIKSLIQYLDKPQPQVALDVLVVDLTLDTDRLIGTQMRNKQGFNDSISGGVNWQTSMLSAPILLNGTPTPPNALMSNLLQLGSPFAAGTNLASNATAGSLILTLTDSQSNGVWSILQMLKQYTNTTVLAQPFIYVQNHKQATVTISQERLLQGDADSGSVAVTVKQEWVKAALVVDIVPHISASHNINLQVTITVDEFVNNNVNTRNNRVIQTNANLGNKQILALGGLTQNTVTLDVNEVPILSKIPVLGYFFKREEITTDKTNLLILICPTIIEPRISGGMEDYTQQKLDFSKNNLDEQLTFQNLRDPVTRWFFRPGTCAGKAVDEYIEEIESKSFTNDLHTHVRHEMDEDADSKPTAPATK